MIRYVLATLLLGGGLLRAQEQMTSERFRAIAGAPGDSVPLVPEIRKLPFSRKATLHTVLRYADGRRVEEVASETTKSVRGRYLVFIGNSELYDRPMYSIIAYDPTASVLHQWSIYDDMVVDSVLNFDIERKVYAQSSSYGDGFTELTAGSYTERGSHERTLVYRAGKLFLTRETEARFVEER